MQSVVALLACVALIAAAPLPLGQVASPKLSAERRTYLENAPSAAPQGLLPGSISISLTWNPIDLGGRDLDLIIVDPNGCVANPKSINNNTIGRRAGFCWLNASQAYHTAIGGGDYNPMRYTPYGGPQILINSPAIDSQSLGTNPIGAEMATIHAPIAGTFHVVAYQKYDAFGFSNVPSATVTFWAGAPVASFAQFHVDRTNYFFDGCAGRFWNVATISFTMDTDDDGIASYTVTPVQTLTSTPQQSFGTTNWFGWESSPRTAAHCTTNNYYYFMDK